MNDNEQEIRKRAHEIWESEGRPDGQHEHHWQKANDEFSGRAAGVDGEENASETTPLASSLQPGGTIPNGGPAGSGADSISSPRKRARP